MGVAERQQPAFGADGEVEDRPGRHVPAIDVASAAVRWRDCDAAHACPRHAERAAERLDRYPHTRAQLGGVAFREVEDPQDRCVKLARRQQPKAGDDARPAPVRQVEAEQLNGERIARLGAGNVDWAREGVDLVKVEGQQLPCV